MLLHLVGAYSAGGAGVVTLSGQNVVTTGTGLTSAYAAIRFNSDGTVDEYESHGAGTWTQVDSLTDWIVPNSSASEATYHVRVQATPPNDDFTTKPSGASVNGTWVDLSTNREWGVEDFDSGVGTTVSTGNFTVEISADGGTTVLASDTYNLSANWRGP